MVLAKEGIYRKQAILSPLLSVLQALCDLQKGERGVMADHESHSLLVRLLVQTRMCLLYNSGTGV